MSRSKLPVCKLLGCIALTLFAYAPAHAAEVSDAEEYHPSFNAPVSLGGMSSNLSGSQGYSLIVEGENHFTQRLGLYGLKQYGEGESRLEVGNGFGISLGATSGITLLGLKKDQSVAPHIGIEPFSGRVTWNTNSNRENFYEYLPMVSAGLQFAAGSCRILPLVRGGGGIGNLGKTGLLPNARLGYGAGSYVDCKEFDLSAERTWLSRSTDRIALDTADATWRVQGDRLSVGLRGERMDGSTVSERRVLFLLRSKLDGLISSRSH